MSRSYFGSFSLAYSLIRPLNSKMASNSSQPTGGPASSSGSWQHEGDSPAVAHHDIFTPQAAPNVVEHAMAMEVCSPPCKAAPAHLLHAQTQAPAALDSVATGAMAAQVQSVEVRNWAGASRPTHLQGGQTTGVCAAGTTLAELGLINALGIECTRSAITSDAMAAQVQSEAPAATSAMAATGVGGVGQPVN